ncbi:MAG: hypothetical protein ACXVCY_13010 [Pseudobdellovibrionaceae bacterium]
MKTILSFFVTGLAVALISPKTFACSNFAGDYEDKTQIPSWLHVDQNECSGMSLTFDFNHQMQTQLHHFADGLQHEIFASNEVVSNETATWDGEQLIYTTIDKYIFEKKNYITHGKLYLDASKNLVDDQEIFDEQGHSLHHTLTTWKRVP